MLTTTFLNVEPIDVLVGGGPIGVRHVAPAQVAQFQPTVALLVNIGIQHVADATRDDQCHAYLLFTVNEATLLFTGAST